MPSTGLNYPKEVQCYIQSVLAVSLPCEVKPQGDEPPRITEHHGARALRTCAKTDTTPSHSTLPISRLPSLLQSCSLVVRVQPSTLT